MPISNADLSINYPELLKDMLAACKSGGLGENFAAESGVFLGQLFGFMKNAGDKLGPNAFGAMMCVMPLSKLYGQNRLDETLRYGALLLEGLNLSDLDQSVRREVAAARGSVLSNMNNAARRLGYLERALDFSNDEMTFIGECSPVEQSKALSNRGLILQELKRIRAAEQYYRQALTIIENQGRSSDETSAQRTDTVKGAIIANLASLRNERDQGEPLAGLTVARRQSTGPLREFPGLFVRRDSQAAEINAVGLNLQRAGKIEDAIIHFLLARTEAARGSVEERGIIESNLAFAYEALGNIDEASSRYQEAIRLHEADPACWEALAKDYFNYGVSCEKRLKRDEALKCYKAAWDLVRDRPEKPLVTVSILRHLGLMRLLEKDFPRARAIFDRGIEIYEALRPNIADGEEGQRGTLDRYRSLLELYLILAYREGWHDHASLLIERGKSRFWYESLIAFAPADALQPATPFLSIADLTPANYPADNIATFNFFVGPNQTFAAVNFKGFTEIHDVGLTEYDLRDRVAVIRTELRACSASDAPSSTASELAKALFGATASVLRMAKAVILMPDGPLWSLPFDSLPIKSEGGELVRLLDVVPTILAPSHSVLKLLHETRTTATTVPPTLLVSEPAFGDDLEPLLGARLEAELISQALGGRLRHLYGKAATKARVLDRAADTDEAGHAFQ